MKGRRAMRPSKIKAKKKKAWVLVKNSIFYSKKTLSNKFLLLIVAVRTQELCQVFTLKK